VLAGLGRGDGVLWVGAGEATTVGVVQGAAGQRGGVRVCSSSSPPSLTARVGAEGASQAWLQGSSEGEHTTSHRCCRREIGRIQELFLAPFRRGESLPEAFFINMVASGVMCE
jgi:hypothetical protein